MPTKEDFKRLNDVNLEKEFWEDQVKESTFNSESGKSAKLNLDFNVEYAYVMNKLGHRPEGLLERLSKMQI